MKKKKKALLVNLGGPRNTAEIEKFLKDLLCDPLVLDLPLPEFLRLPLARFIARKRAPRVAEAYSAMGFGGGSPLVPETERQARALAQALNRQSDDTWEVEITMACGYPDIRDLDAAALTPTPDNVIVPLFPQFSRSTTLSVASIIEDKIGRCPAAGAGFVRPFFDDSEFLQAMVQLITDFFTGQLASRDFLHFEPLAVSNWQDVTIVFSAHGIPLRLIKKGDRYREQIEWQFHSLSAALKSAGLRAETHLSFQSRLGPAKWTEPNTINKLQELGQSGIKRVAIFPISFVSDHLETLEEIGMQLRTVALEAGVEEYYRIPAPGVYPPFIDALAKIIRSAADDLPGKCICKGMGGMNPSNGSRVFAKHCANAMR